VWTKTFDTEEHVRIRRQYIVMSIGLVLAAACAGQQANTDYSPSTRFTQFRTFALVMPPDTGAEQLLDQRVRNAVQTQLDAKGLALADREKADLYVGYGVVDKTHTTIYDYDNGWGWGGGRWGWRYYRWGLAWPAYGQQQIQTYNDGTVVVNLVDAKTKQVVWKGEVDDVVDLPVSNPLDATKQIDAAVAKMFAKYPPQTSGA
jgi:Domain of unknown function (DUF4136)